jgi:glycosyltransferase involved in cell wall biosynthesis
MKKMVINFFSDFIFPGGIPVHEGNLAVWLKKKYDCEVRLCIPWPLRYDMECNKEFFCRADEKGKLSSLFAPLKYVRKIDSIDTLQKTIDSAMINHFHGTFTTGREFLGEAIFVAKNKKTNIYTFHSEAVNPKCISDNDQIRKRLDNVSKIVAVSRRVKESVLKVVPDRDVVVVPNGFCCCMENISRVNDMFTVLFVGRLNKTKGIECIIEFAKSIQEKNIRLIIAGNAEFDSVYNDQVAKLASLNPKILWIQNPLSHNDLLKLYVESDVFLFPSQMEGSPLVVLDALKNGVVPVCSSVGCVGDFIQSGNNGFVENYDDFEKLINHVYDLYEDPSLLAKMKTCAKETVLNSWEAVADLTYSLYCGML